jgi:hypothetical protein
MNRGVAMNVFVVLVGIGMALCITSQPALSKSAATEGVTAKVNIKASPCIVWEAVHNERAKDPDLNYSRVIEQIGTKIFVEQKFNPMPMIGAPVCLIEQEETLQKRIDYKLVRSDKFKNMVGSWILEETPDGGTSLELHSMLDTGLPCSQLAINMFLKDKINKRLARVKGAAELLAQSNPTVADAKFAKHWHAQPTK